MALFETRDDGDETAVNPAILIRELRELAGMLAADGQWPAPQTGQQADALCAAIRCDPELDGGTSLAHALRAALHACADIGVAAAEVRDVTGVGGYTPKSEIAPPHTPTASQVHAIANRLSQVAGIGDEADDPPAAVHSPDFRSVNWFGTTYSFTANQARVIESLWMACEQGTPDVGDETLLNAVDHESPPTSLRNLFRNNAAWGTLIVEGGSKGSHRLAEPKENLA